MKKLLTLVLAALICLMPIAAMAEGVELTMGSWRTDDVAQVTALLEKYEQLTGVKITFQPTTPTEYNATLRLQLDNGNGPDLFYSRSYATGAELCDAGFNVICNDIPGVMENFTDSVRGAWTDAEGHVFAVPFAAVSQVIYYNKAIFAQEGVEELPATWEDFIALCEKLKGDGITPLANGIADNWDILECVLLGMVPNYITFEDRLAYESGEKKLNDETWVKIYEDFAKLVPYLPDGFEAVGNADSNMLFATGQTAMLIDGSWNCGTLNNKDEYPDLDLGFMAFPAPEGNAPGLCLHADMGIAGNAASKHPEEVKAFLEWLASPEGAQITADYLPGGFLPIINAELTLQDETIAELAGLSEGKNTDVRFTWAKMNDVLYTPLVENLNAICRGETTPQAAADAINELWEAALAG